MSSSTRVLHSLDLFFRHSVQQAVRSSSIIFVGYTLIEFASNRRVRQLRNVRSGSSLGSSCLRQRRAQSCVACVRKRAQTENNFIGTSARVSAGRLNGITELIDRDADKFAGERPSKLAARRCRGLVSERKKLDRCTMALRWQRRDHRAAFRPSFSSFVRLLFIRRHFSLFFGFTIALDARAHPRRRNRRASRGRMEIKIARDGRTGSRKLHGPQLPQVGRIALGYCHVRDVTRERDGKLGGGGRG